MIEASYKDESRVEFEDVSCLMRWSAARLGVVITDLRAEIGGVHCDAVQVWIWTGDFDADEAVCAGLSPNVARAWQVLV